MREIDKLAHELAWDQAVSALDSVAVNVLEGRKKWMDLGDEGSAGTFDRDLRYLELRGALVRHPKNKFWIRIGKPREVA